MLHFRGYLFAGDKTDGPVGRITVPLSLHYHRQPSRLRHVRDHRVRRLRPQRKEALKNTFDRGTSWGRVAEHSATDRLPATGQDVSYVVSRV